MSDHHSKEGGIFSLQPDNLGHLEKVLEVGVEWQAKVQDESLSGGLELDASPADLDSSPMDPGLQIASFSVTEFLSG